MDLDGLEEYHITFYKANDGLTGLSIVLHNRDAKETYVRILNYVDQHNLGYIATPIEEVYETQFLSILRDNGTLKKWMEGQIDNGSELRIPVPFRIRNPIVKQIPSPPQFDELPIQINLPEVTPPVTLPGPNVLPPYNLNIQFTSWDDIPSSVTTAVREIESLLDQLEADPHISVVIEANVGGGAPSTDPDKQAAERRVFGRSALELAEDRRDNVVGEARKRARRRGIDPDRITGRVGSQEERSVRAVITGNK